MCSTAGDRGGTRFERELREMNEALLVSSIHQHELTEKAQRAEAALRQSEAALRSQTEKLLRFNIEMRHSEERYRTLFNSIDEGFLRAGDTIRCQGPSCRLSVPGNQSGL